MADDCSSIYPIGEPARSVSVYDVGAGALLAGALLAPDGGTFPNEITSCGVSPSKILQHASSGSADP